MTKSDSIIKISKLNKWYGKFHALKDIDLSVGRTEKIVICGPSGSGKSTLIRCINRLEVHQEGSIQVDGIELTDDIKQITEICIVSKNTDLREFRFSINCTNFSMTKIIPTMIVK